VWSEGRDPVWIDVESRDADELRGLLKDLGFADDLVGHALLHDSTGRVIAHAEATFFEYPIPAPDGSAALVGFLVTEGLVTTFHRHALSDDFVAEVLARLEVPVPSTSGLVSAIVQNHALRLRRAALDLRDRAREAAALMDDDPEAVTLDDILALKRRLLDLDRMSDEQEAVFESLPGLEKPHLRMRDPELGFAHAVENVEAADRRLERMDRRVAELQQRHESLQQDKINKRLGFLTIISAIFMPLTLVVGIYGMNFDHMPELHFRYGYFFALGGMAFIAIALLAFFWWRKWLK
jgi:magnesium transporter